MLSFFFLNFWTLGSSPVVMECKLISLLPVCVHVCAHACPHTSMSVQEQYLVGGEKVMEFLIVKLLTGWGTSEQYQTWWYGTDFKDIFGEILELEYLYECTFPYYDEVSDILIYFMWIHRHLWVEAHYSIMISCPPLKKKTLWPKYLSRINKSVDWPGKNMCQVCILEGSWE